MFVLVLPLKILADLHELIKELLDFFSMEKRIELEGKAAVQVTTLKRFMKSLP